MNKISDLRIGQGRVDVEGEIKSIEPERSFNKFGREVRVTNALIEDDSGSIKLTLWNQDIDNVKVGDKVKISNGYVNEFQGEKQLTSGKFGKLEIVGKIAEEAEKEAEEPEKEAEEKQKIGRKAKEEKVEEETEEEAGDY